MLSCVVKIGHLIYDLLILIALNINCYGFNSHLPVVRSNNMFGGSVYQLPKDQLISFISRLFVKIR